MRELWWNLGAYGGVALLATSIIFGIGMFVSKVDTPRYRLLRLRPVRWSGHDVLLAFCIWQCVSWLLITILDAFPSHLDSLRESLISTPLILTTVFAIWLILLLARRGVRAHDFGLSWGHWRTNLANGLITFLWMTPIVLCLHAVLSLVLWDRPQPFTPQNTADLACWEWGLVAFQACVAAPLLEETFFRGLLQNWLRQASLLGHVVVVLATLFLGVNGIAYDDTKAEVEVIDAGPLVFACLLVAGYLYLLYSLKRIYDLNPDEVWAGHPLPNHFLPDSEKTHYRWHDLTSAIAVIGSAMLFAMLHVQAWPAPIALFVMGLGLGMLARATQSLIGPIAFHAAFNLVAFITLYGSSLTSPAGDGNAQTTAARPSVVKAVPASQLPRRK